MSGTDVIGVWIVGTVIWVFVRILRARHKPPMDEPEYVEGEVVDEDDLRDLDEWFSRSARRGNHELPPPK